MRRMHEDEQSGATSRPQRRARETQPAQDPAGGPAQEALEALQRSAGNAAVRQLLGPQEISHAPADAGSGLPAAVRRKAERRLGQPLADVRVHAERAAGSYAERLGAEAVTVGRDIYLGPGAGDPATLAGERTLMHELVHVAQADGGPQNADRVSDGQSAVEREAARVAETGLSGAPTRVMHVAPAGVAHRQVAVEEEQREADVAPEQSPAPAHETGAGQAETAAGLGRPQAGGPASPLAALFDAAIIARLREARDYVSAQPPDPRAAHASLLGARDAIKALAASYRQSNPLLHAKLWTWHNALLAVDIRVKAMAGEGSTFELILSELQVAQEGIGSLRDQLG